MGMEGVLQLHPLNKKRMVVFDSRLDWSVLSWRCPGHYRASRATWKAMMKLPRLFQQACDTFDDLGRESVLAHGQVDFA